MLELNSDFYSKLNNERVNEFSNYAFTLHNEIVNQKYGENNDLPYSYHISSVIEYAKNYVHLVAESLEDILPILFGAAFHDSIEDARLTYNDVMKIAKQYMSEDHALMATEIVYALTNEKGRNRAERANDKYYEGIRNTKYAPFVKMCDRLANMTYSYKNHSSMSKKYEMELSHFLSSIVESANSPMPYNVPEEMVNVARLL